MRDFAHYRNENAVKKQSKDEELAKSLLKDARQRIEAAKELPIGKYPKLIFENAYDALRSLLDALLACDGYKSYSHEASIAYLKEFSVEDSVMRELDNFRYLRNGSKYYGKGISPEEAHAILNFYGLHGKKLIAIIHGKVEKEH
jgi:uncharacterized protein (UPF0332 family)